MPIERRGREKPAQPCIVYVENDPFDAELAAIAFNEQGVQTILARSILEGEAILTNLETAAYHLLMVRFTGFHTMIEKPLTVQQVQMMGAMLQQSSERPSNEGGLGQELE